MKHRDNYHSKIEIKDMTQKYKAQESSSQGECDCAQEIKPAEKCHEREHNGVKRKGDCEEKEVEI